MDKGDNFISFEPAFLAFCYSLAEGWVYDAPLPEDPARIEGMYMSWARAVEGRYSTVAQRAVLAKRLPGLLALISKQLIAKFGEQQLDGLVRA